MEELGEEDGLRRELRELRDELDTIARETSHAHAALREPDDEGVAAPPGIQGKTALVAVSTLFMPAAIVAVIFFSGGSSASSSETLYGRVRAKSGPAPAAVDGRCTIFLRSVNDDDSSFDTRITVLCDRHLVYGGEKKGYIECGRHGARLWRCRDTGYTNQGGDPRLELDRGSRRVHVDDRLPDWSVDIELTTPPAGARGTDGAR